MLSKTISLHTLTLTLVNPQNFRCPSATSSVRIGRNLVIMISSLKKFGKLSRRMRSLSRKAFEFPHSSLVFNSGFSSLMSIVSVTCLCIASLPHDETTFTLTFCFSSRASLQYVFKKLSFYLLPGTLLNVH